MSDGGPDFASLVGSGAVPGGGGASAAAGSGPPGAIPGGIFSQILGITPIPGGTQGINRFNTSGVMDKKFAIIAGPQGRATGPLAFLNIALAPHFVPVSAMTGANYDNAPVQPAQIEPVQFQDLQIGPAIQNLGNAVAYNPHWNGGVNHGLGDGSGGQLEIG